MKKNKALFNDIQKAIESSIDKAPSRQAIRKEILNTIKDAIIDRTAKGKGVKESTKKEYTLPPLKDSYVKLRKKSKNLSIETSPSKSNITATGLLLYKSFSVSGGLRQISVFIKKINYKKTLTGIPKKTVNTHDVMNYLRESGREFLQTTYKDDQELRDLISDEIIRYLNKTIKVS